jgi:hypothetical protein
MLGHTLILFKLRTEPRLQCGLVHKLRTIPLINNDKNLVKKSSGSTMDREKNMQRVTSPQSYESRVMTSKAAANADRLGEGKDSQTSIEATGGWDAYEVWRRFIKDARDRRDTDTPS